MVRVYKRKTKRGETGSMAEALSLMKEGYTLRRAAAEAKVDKTTLSRRWKNKDHGGYKQPRIVFTKEDEKELQEYLMTCSRMCHGLTPQEVRKLAYEYATLNEIQVPESWKRKLQAGKDWLKAFMKRSGSLSIRKPEATSLGRATSFNRHNVKTFFNNLGDALKKYKIEPGNIHNMDETKITTVHNPPRVVADKKVKQLGQVTSAERGVLVTGVCCVSSSGTSIPPTFIWPRKTDRNTEAYMRGTPTNSLGLFHETGWMTAPNFDVWMNHFIKHAKPSLDNPALLLLDNHKSHMSPKAIKAAKENGVVMLTFPPHTTHRLQPLDVSVYGPYQTYYNTACNEWQLSNPGKTLGLYDIGELAGKALLRAQTPENITGGFRKTGIYPMDINVFTDSDFLPSAVTDRDIGREGVAMEQDGDDGGGEDAVMEVDLEFINTPSTSSVVRTAKTGTSPADIRPYPKAAPRKGTTKSKKGASIILTKTPEKTLSEPPEVPAGPSTSGYIPKKVKKRVLKKVPQPDVETSEEEDCVPIESDSDDEYSEDFEHDNVNDDDQPFSVKEGSYVVVQYESKKMKHLYVGQVKSIEDGSAMVAFLKKTGTNHFLLPDNPETDTVDIIDITQVLPEPSVISGTARCAAKRAFDVDLSCIHG